jgi:hypothetical protein
MLMYIFLYTSFGANHASLCATFKNIARIIVSAVYVIA